MALTHQGFITVQDDAGRESTLIVHMPVAVLAQDAVDFIGLLIDEIDPIIVGGIVRAGVTLACDIAGHGTIGALADVQEKGEFTFNTLNLFLAAVGLPSFDESLIVASSDTIDLTDGDVVDFVDAMIDGIEVPSTNTVVPCDSRGETLVSVKSALERFRRR